MSRTEMLRVGGKYYIRMIVTIHEFISKMLVRIFYLIICT